MPKTPQDVRDLREETSHNTIDRLKALALECNKKSNHNTKTYENLTENLELQTLESQLWEVKNHAYMLQAQLKALLFIDQMIRSHEQLIAQQKIHMI